MTRDRISLQDRVTIGIAGLIFAVVAIAAPTLLKLLLEAIS